MAYHYSLQKGIQLCWHVAFIPLRPCWTSIPKHCKLTNSCFFKASKLMVTVKASVEKQYTAQSINTSIHKQFIETLL